jgi:hypothetical protein
MFLQEPLGNLPKQEHHHRLRNLKDQIPLELVELERREKRLKQAIAEVADQYTADFPQPVACTTSTRALGAMTAATASSWSSRGTAPSPASRCSTVSR